MKHTTVKKLCAGLLTLALMICALPGLGEQVIVNKVKNPDADFEFAPDAELLEVFIPPVYGCDAAYVRMGDHGMLIDCGGSQWRTFDDMLARLGVTRVDYAVNSHPDADHIGGFNKVLEHIACGEFVLGFPEDYPDGDDVRFKVYSDLHALDIPFHRAHDGETLEFGGAQVTAYQRLDEELPRVNNRSLMLMIQWGERRIFFTGDIQLDTQKLLAEQGDPADYQADILKHPHHGYRPMYAPFLEMVSPELVYMTSGGDGAEGKTLLKEKQISFLYAEQGPLRMATDGKTWVVEKVKLPSVKK